MNKKATILIELNYDIDDLRFMVGEDFPEEQFKERVIEQALHDISEYQRTEPVDVWGKLTLHNQPDGWDERWQDGYNEAIDMVIDVCGEMYNSMEFHNPTLDELENRIV